MRKPTLPVLGGGYGFVQRDKSDDEYYEPPPVLRRSYEAKTGVKTLPRVVIGKGHATRNIEASDEY